VRCTSNHHHPHHPHHPHHRHHHHHHHHHQQQQQQQQQLDYNDDAGEGTVSALTTALNGELVPVHTTDAHGRTVTASFGWLTPATAVIEMSSASGLALVRDLPLSPRTASTFGTAPSSSRSS
jgi:glycerate kinase